MRRSAPPSCSELTDDFGPAFFQKSKGAKELGNYGFSRFLNEPLDATLLTTKSSVRGNPMSKRLRQSVPMTTYLLYGVLTACFIMAIAVAVVARAH